MLRATSSASVLRRHEAISLPESAALRSQESSLVVWTVGWIVVLSMLAWVHSHPGKLRWQYDLVQSLLALMSAGMLWKVVSRPSFATRFVGNASAFDLGAMRAIICGALAAMAYCEQIGAVSWLPFSSRYSVGIMSWLYAAPLGINWLTQHHAAMVTLKIVTVVALLLAAAGYRSRVTLALGTLLYLLLGGIVRSYLTFTHNGIIPLFLVTVLNFTPCADGFSLDRRRRIHYGISVASQDELSARYGWARFALWCTLATCYLMAGMSKLRFGGWMWWDGVNIQSMIFKTGFKPYADSFIHVDRWSWAPTWSFSCIGIYTLVTELGMVLTPFSRRARRVWPVMAILMHLGIRLLQTIAFWDLILLQAIFIDFGAMRERFKRSDRGAGRRPLKWPARLEVARARREKLPEQSSCTSRLRLTIAVSVLLCTWAMHAEFYPLTSIAMYSHHYTSGVLSYYWIIQTDARGVTKPADLAALTPESRVFHIPLWHAFSSPSERQKSLELLRFCGDQWNRTAPPDKRLTRIEIQRREWDYLHNRFDPEHGRSIESMSVRF